MNTIDNKTRALGRAIKQIRLNRNISQEKLAELSGLHRTYISDVERGTRNITVKNIFYICASLNTYPSYLFKKYEDEVKSYGS